MQDVTGFIVGSRSEHGIIKDGKLNLNAVANSVVPKITIIIGNSCYGNYNYAKADPWFIYAWPSGKIAVIDWRAGCKNFITNSVSGKKYKWRRAKLFDTN